jgi:Xaa-Pro aminopeptidase
MYPHQAERLDGALARLGVSAIVATSAANVAYITGFRSPSRQVHPATEIFAVFARTGTALVIPAIDAPAFAAGDVDADQVICYGRFHASVAERADATARRAAELMASAVASPADGVAAALRALGVADGAVGLDSAPLTESSARAIVERLAGAKIHPVSVALAEARLVKGPYEIDCLQQALRIAEESIHEVLGELEAGTTEREAVAVYERALGRRGARPSATIIAFGPNTALPAVAPGDRALRPGDFVRFDVGCVFKGYHATVARMAVLGEPTAPQQERYDAVEAGIDAALGTIRPGAAARSVLDAAVSAVRAAGIPAFQRHHVGHGIGLEPAEPPWLAADGPVLEAGMVLRVETPFYELGAAGLHVKETVLVNQGGAAVMNRSNRGLVVLD